MSPDLVAALFAWLWIGMAAVGRELGLGLMAAVPLLLLFVTASRLRPEMSALALVYGWALMGQLGSYGESPVFSIMTAWAIVCLLVLNPAQGAWRFLGNRYCLTSLAFLGGFLTIGSIHVFVDGASTSGQSYVVNLLKGWLGLLVVGFLCCRIVDDVRRLLRLVPGMFLMYVATLRVEDWREFVGLKMHSLSLYSIGLAEALLNNNLLGGAAAIASIVALASAFYSKERFEKWGYVILSCLGIIIVVLSSSRQALLSWFVGVITLLLIRGWRRVFALVPLLISVGALYVATSLIPESSGLSARLKELTQPTQSWHTRSSSDRLEDFRLAVGQFKDAPILGHGFHERFSHNVFLDVLVSTGLVGLACFSLFSIWTVRSYFRAVRRVATVTERAEAKQLILPMLAALFVQENISGGTWGMDLGLFIVLMGAMLSATGSARRGLVGRCRFQYNVVGSETTPAGSS